MSNHTPDNFTLATSKETQTSIGREAAIELFNSGWWEGKTVRDIVGFQLSTTELCLPFDKFHEATEKALERPVWTHEFAFFDSLIKEFHGTAPKATMVDVMEKIPKDKRVVIIATHNE